MSGAVPPTVDTHAGAGGGAGAGAGAFTPTPTGHHRRSSSNSPAVHNPDAGRKGKPAHLFHDKVLHAAPRVTLMLLLLPLATVHSHLPHLPTHLGTDGVPCGHSPPSHQGRARQSHEDPTVLRGLQCGLPRTAMARQPCEGGWGLDLPGYWYYSLLQVPGKCVYVCGRERSGGGRIHGCRGPIALC